MSYTRTELEELTVAALHELARDTGLVGYSSLRKAVLISELLNAQNDEPQVKEADANLGELRQESDTDEEVQGILDDIRMALRSGAKKANVGTADSEVERKVLALLMPEEQLRVVFGVSPGVTTRHSVG